MKIVVHDFAGHPFQIQLSRALARRGHVVHHLYCGSLVTTPSGTMTRRGDDPQDFEIRPISLPETIDKYSFFKRWRQERAYGRLLGQEVRRIKPDAVLSGNTPLDAQRTLQHVCSEENIRFVFWLQDVLSVATQRILARKYPGVGHLVGRHYVAMEQKLLRASDAVVLITDDFRPLMRAWQVRDKETVVIENWSPIDDVPVKRKSNPWSIANNLDDKTCFVYTGTLGMKHNPQLLLDLARTYCGRPDVRVVVLSSGLGADWLKERIADEGIRNLLVMDFCSFETLPDVLGTADILVALLERNAGVYSVPSKVLTYLCAGRPLLLAVPSGNLAARLVAGNRLGIVTDPEDRDAFLAAADKLLNDAELRRQIGFRCRGFAERTFDIDRITDDFESVLTATYP